MFDGKKRFTVKIERILAIQKSMDPKSINGTSEKIGTSSKMISCRVTMMPSLLNGNDIQGKGQKVSFWPFNRKDQVMEVTLGLSGAGTSYVYEFVIYSPIGKIVGHMRD